MRLSLVLLADFLIRIFRPGGRMMLMVPNRAGLWAASDRTPFGFGRSYTTGQIEAQMRRAGFQPDWHGSAIYIPPSDRRFWLKSAQMWERTGSRIASVLIAGVVVAEFAKQVPAMVGPAQKILVPSPLEVLGGIRKPRPLARPAPHPSGGQGRAGMDPPGR